MNEDKISIQLCINGVWKDLDVEPEETLVRTLRERLKLTGTKINCEQGECGACTVLLDGRAVNSCLILTVSIDGRRVTTIEGLSREGRLDPLQEAFLEEDASQCGYCTPGMILSAKGLLDENSDPTDDEIRQALSGNYCRCTGYKTIIKAVKRGAEKYKMMHEEGRN